MNERLLELARQVWPDPNISHTNHMKFAELIVKECCQKLENDGCVEIAIELKQHFGVKE